MSLMRAKLNVVDIYTFNKEETKMYNDDSFATGYAIGRDSTNGNGNSGFGWGNDSAWWIIILLIFGWGGNNGFGGFGGGGSNGIAENYTLATDFANIERKLDGVNNGLCDGFYAQNTNMLTGFSNIQQTLCQGFNGIERSIADTNSNLANSICTLGYQNQAGFNSLGNQLASCCCGIERQISDCCCETRSAIADLKYANERQTCDILAGQSAQTRAILDYLTNEKIEGLRAENVALKGQISNDRQSAYIIDALAPKCPQPAFVVQPPQQVTFPTNCCGNVAYANFSNGCGTSVL